MQHFICLEFQYFRRNCFSGGVYTWCLDRNEKKKFAIRSKVKHSIIEQMFLTIVKEMYFLNESLFFVQIFFHMPSMDGH